MRKINNLSDTIMKKGMALEGYIMEDGTIRPMKHYDDTELRGKIQTNTDNIDNINSRVKYIEDHGAPLEDITKADKVINATEGNLAGLDENGNLTDSGKKSSDFAESSHIHSQIANDEDENAVVRCGLDNGAGKIEFSVQDGGGDDKVATITHDKVDNLNRALETPSSAPEDDATKLITSKAVYDALAIVHGSQDIVFDISGTSLVLDISNTSIYAPLFKESESQFLAEVYAFDSTDDKSYHFIAFCKANVDTTKYVTELFVGDYVIVLNKAKVGGAVTIDKQYSLSSLLNPSFLIRPSLSEEAES